MLIHKSSYAKSVRLLDSVCYVSRSDTTTTLLDGSSVVVRSTYVHSPDSKKAAENADYWARLGSDSEPRKASRANEPFYATLLDIDVRSQGGRACRAVDDDGNEFDLREDQLLEAVRLGGIAAGGRILSQFVWCVVGSTVKMVVVDGKVYMRAAQVREITRKSGAVSLVPGRVYQMKNGDRRGYLGRCRTPEGGKLHYAFIEMPDVVRKSPYSREISDEFLAMSWDDRILSVRSSRSGTGDYLGFDSTVMLFASKPNFLCEDGTFDHTKHRVPFGRGAYSRSGAWSSLFEEWYESVEIRPLARFCSCNRNCTSKDYHMHDCQTDSAWQSRAVAAYSRAVVWLDD